MPKKKKTTTRRSKNYGSSNTGGIDDHSFLIIIGGGFIVIAIIGLFMFNRPAKSLVMAETTPKVAEQSENTVTINDFKFSKPSITVKVGTTVTWENTDTVEHSAVADDNTFDTKVLAPGEKGSFTFTKAGTYTYHCEMHPSMTGTVIVE